MKNAKVDRTKLAIDPRAASAPVGDGEITHAVYMAFELVAGDHRADPGGRAGEDQVAGLQRDEVREVRDLLGHAPDLLREVALLLHRAVHLHPDRALGGMADLARRAQRRHRSALVEALAHLPRPPHLLRFRLD